MKTCPKCGELNGDQLTNCFKCGTFIGQAAKQPPISNAPTTYQTSFGSFVFGVGIAFIIIGALGSIFASFLTIPGYFSWSIFFVGLFSSFISGLIICALGKMLQNQESILQYLAKIENKQKP